MYMRKILTLLFVSIFVGLSCVTSSYAALSDGYISDCLNAPGWTPSHAANLTIKTKEQGAKNIPAVNTDTWVFVCITAGEDTHCSAGGDGSTDELLFGSKEHYNKMLDMIGEDGKGNVGYVGGVVEGTGYSNQSPPPQTDNNAGNPQFTSDVTWGDAYYPGVTHQWSWVQVAAPIVEDGEGAGAGAGGALQQGTTPFDQEQLILDTKECAIIGWDPRGVVFDVNTLLPVKGISVELSKLNPVNDIYEIVPNDGLFLINPSSTSHPGKENGQYSFFVDTGWYKLKLINPERQIVSLTPSQLETATKLGIDNIYTKDQSIYEKAGTVKIANVPVDITDESLLVKELTRIDNVAPTLEGNGIRLFGRVSHPKTKMIITKDMMNAAGEIKQFVTTDYTDGLGEYPNKLISQTVVSAEPLVFQNATLTFELNSFYTTGVFTQKEQGGNKVARFLKEVWGGVLKKLEARAAVTPKNTIVIKPMPLYIEGIAYDTKGVAIPKAIVGLYPFYSEKPYYLTIADENGRYKIGSQHIPRFEYTLRYKKPTGEVVVIDTSIFIKQNAKLIINEGIKPFVAKKTTLAEDKKIQDYFTNVTTPIELKAPNKPSTSSRNPSVSSTPQTGTGGGTTGAGMQGIVMVVVAIIVLIMIGVGAFIMMKSKQQSSSQY